MAALQHAYCATNQFANLPASSITITGGPTTANRTRLVDGRVDKLYETGSGITSWAVKFELPSAKQLDAIAILNHNGTAGNFRVFTEAADNSSMLSGLVTVKADTFIRATDALLEFASPPTKQFWRLTFTHSSMNAKIGEIYAAQTTALTRAVVFGRTKAQVFFGTDSMSDMGRQFGHFLSGPVTRLGLVWEDLTESQKDEVVAMHNAAKGSATDILWAERWDRFNTTTAQTDPTQECYYGRLLEKELSPRETDYGLWGGLSLTIQSQTRGVGL